MLRRKKSNMAVFVHDQIDDDNEHNILVIDSFTPPTYDTVNEVSDGDDDGGFESEIAELDSEENASKPFQLHVSI